MKTILSIIAVFSCCTLAAQEYTPSYSRELPRSQVLVYPTAQEASAAGENANRYLTPLTEWSRQGDRFTTDFIVPFAWANRQILLYLGWASADYEVTVNGHKVGYNSDCSTPGEFNITRYAQEGRNSVEIVLSAPSLVMALESWKGNPTPAIGPARVMSQPTLRIRDVLTKTWRGDKQGDTAMAEIGLVAKTESLNPRTSRIHYELLTPGGKTVTTGYKDITLDMRREDTVRFLARIPDSMLWSPARTTRHILRVKTQHEGRYAEYLEIPLGLRTTEFHEGQVAVNGVPISLRMREVAPHITPQEIAALREQGYNTLRLLPGAVAPSLFTVCDTMGMFVIAQAPIDTRSSGDSRRKGGNPSNDPAWQAAYIERAEDNYHTTKRHPSVIAFSQATQSSNGICLYESYLRMKQFDEQRPFIYPDAAGEWNSDHLKME